MLAPTEKLVLPDGEKLEIRITDYLGNGRDYGVFFLKSRIYSLPTSERPTDIRTFYIKLVLEGESNREVLKSTSPKKLTVGRRELTVRIGKELKTEEPSRHNEPDDMLELLKDYRREQEKSPKKYIVKKRNERLFFHFTGNISNYYEEHREDCHACKGGKIKKPNEPGGCYDCGGKGAHTFGSFNYVRLIKDFAQKEFDEARARLIRKFNRAKVKPFKRNDSEYIEFTKETARNWGPPHSFKAPDGTDKFYCYASVGKHPRDNEPRKRYAVIDPANFTSSSIPWGFIIPGFTKQNQNNEIYHLTKKEKRELFKKFPEWVKNHIYRMIFKPRWHSVEETIQGEMPWRLYLAGTDDVSYTKWFPTKKAAMRELKRLRRMQPCDFNKDVLRRKYVFTN